MTLREKIRNEVSESVDALDHVVLWMTEFAIPRLTPDDCDGGNQLAAGLEHRADKLRDLLKEIDDHDDSDKNDTGAD